MSQPRRFLCGSIPPLGGTVLLSETEKNHALKVLRLTLGSLVIALDGKGKAVIAELCSLPQGIGLKATSELPADSAENTNAINVVLEIAILKGDAMEWTIEKAVELGVSQFQPIVSERTVVQIREKGPEFFKIRWQKIADQALKQCERLKRMEILLPISLQDILKPMYFQSGVRFLALERRNAVLPDLLTSVELREFKNNEFDHYRWMVGPEGGWSDQEVTLFENTIKKEDGIIRPVTLGPTIMRAETAALYGVSVLQSWINRKNSGTFYS